MDSTYQQVARRNPEEAIEGAKTTESETEGLSDSKLKQRLKGPALILQQLYSYRNFTIITYFYFCFNFLYHLLLNLLEPEFYI